MVRIAVELTALAASLPEADAVIGGPTGQAGAIRHGIARALVEVHDGEADFKTGPLYAWPVTIGQTAGTASKIYNAKDKTFFSFAFTTKSAT